MTAPLTPSQSPARDLMMGGGQAQSWDGSCAGSTHFLDATHLQIQGSCQFAHVGRLTFAIEQELSFGPVITYSGRTTYTAPNGDELHTAHSGIATPTADGLAVTLAGTETAVNGTGRFSGAVGSAVITGTSFLAGPHAGTGSYNLLGSLSFPSRQRQVRELTVMTYNIYQGTELQNAISATTGQEFVIGATKDFLLMRANNFSDRARAIAAEVAATQPDLIGLQEVALWRSGPHTTPAQPAVNVEQDFLQLLLDALRERGLSYSVASSVANFDVQGPALLSASGLTDVRLTDRDVILARSDELGAEIKISNPLSGNYATNLVLTTVAGPITVVEGWASIDVSYRGRSLRFITTHLDASAPAVRLAQANELLSGAARTDFPVILAGDMNTTSTTDTYAAITGAGFADVWPLVRSTDPGFTCCQTESLDNAVSALYERVDLFLLRGNLEAESISRIGADVGTRTLSGLWPSDHAGVVATVILGKEN